MLIKNCVRGYKWVAIPHFYFTTTKPTLGIFADGVASSGTLDAAALMLSNNGKMPLSRM